MPYRVRPLWRAAPSGYGHLPFSYPAWTVLSANGVLVAQSLSWGTYRLNLGELPPPEQLIVMECVGDFVPLGASPDGIAVGNAIDADSDQDTPTRHAVLLSPESAAPTVILKGAPYAAAHAIDAAHRVVGVTIGADGVHRPFLWVDGEVSPLTLRGITDTARSGETLSFCAFLPEDTLVGVRYSHHRERSFTYSLRSGRLCWLDPFPDFVSCRARAANGSGTIVGCCFTEGGGSAAFIKRAGGGISRLGKLTDAVHIAEDGTVAGSPLARSVLGELVIKGQSSVTLTSLLAVAESGHLIACGQLGGNSTPFLLEPC